LGGHVTIGAHGFIQLPAGLAAEKAQTHGLESGICRTADYERHLRLDTRAASAVSRRARMVAGFVAVESARRMIAGALALAAVLSGLGVALGVGADLLPRDPQLAFGIVGRWAASGRDEQAQGSGGEI